MVDTSLLNKDGLITIEDLKEHFRLNDFSALTSNYKSKTATSEKNEIYIKSKGFFKTSWEKEMMEETPGDLSGATSETAEVYRPEQQGGRTL